MVILHRKCSSKLTFEKSCSSISWRDLTQVGCFYFRFSRVSAVAIVCRKCTTGCRRPIACLIFSGHFKQKSPIISGSFAKNDLQLKASYGSSLLCRGLQSSEDPWDALSCRSFFAKEPLIIGLFCLKLKRLLRNDTGRRCGVAQYRDSSVVISQKSALRSFLYGKCSSKLTFEKLYQLEASRYAVP